MSISSLEHSIESTVDGLLDVLGQDPPNIVYHYTHAAGLLGMLKSREMWATNLHYLNDKEEFAHALRVAQELLRARDITGFAKGDEPFLDEVKREVATLGSPDVFVACFSENGDSLSQWRAYCQSEVGYAMGFSSAHLRQAAEAQGFKFFKCTYMREKQETLLQGFIGGFVKAQHDLASKMEGVNLSAATTLLARHCARGVALAAPTFKHPSFHEEHEWRLISRSVGSRAGRIGHRAGPVTLIPHFRFQLEPEDKTEVLHSLVVGPSPESALAERAVRSYLTSNDCGACEVSLSESPFRQW